MEFEPSFCPTGWEEPCPGACKHTRTPIFFTSGRKGSQPVPFRTGAPGSNPCCAAVQFLATVTIGRLQFRRRDGACILLRKDIHIFLSKAFARCSSCRVVAVSQSHRWLLPRKWGMLHHSSAKGGLRRGGFSMKNSINTFKLVRNAQCKQQPNVQSRSAITSECNHSVSHLLQSLEPNVTSGQYAT